MKEYRTINALRWGEIVNIDGLKLKMDTDQSGQEKEIQPGDLYVAERNTGPYLLTARNVQMNAVFPTTTDYAFNIYECVKVCEA